MSLFQIQSLLEMSPHHRVPRHELSLQWIQDVIRMLWRPLQTRFRMSNCVQVLPYETIGIWVTLKHFCHYGDNHRATDASICFQSPISFSFDWRCIFANSAKSGVGKGHTMGVQGHHNVLLLITYKQSAWCVCCEVLPVILWRRSNFGSFFGLMSSGCLHKRRKTYEGEKRKT